MKATPFHKGERRAQRRLGLEASMSWARQAIRPFIPDQHRTFYQQLPFLVAAARDPEARPWATLIAGSPGFVQSINTTQLAIAARPVAGDALASAFRVNADVGMLGIELDSRRRNRVNGRIIADEAGVLTFEALQSFGNCPQYITERTWVPADSSANAASVTHPLELDRALTDWIEQADTFFVASGYHHDELGSDRNGMDASHRGGEPGFVEVLSPTTLLFPDYSGNNFFNTIGNLLEDPRIGLLFVDFEHGHLLQLTGTAEIDWDSPEVAKRHGAQRLIKVEIEAMVQLADALPIRWKAPADSRQVLTVVNKVKESEQVSSFLLRAIDGRPLPVFKPGQHLPIEVQLAGEAQPIKRTYSLSNGPNSESYRISVKREEKGLMSRILHDFVDPGATLQAWPPAGDFVLQDSDQPVTLLSAGIGVTPMMSMLQQLVSTRTDREVLFMHGTRHHADHAFVSETHALAAQNPNIRTHIAYSRSNKTDVFQRDFDSRGRITPELVRKLHPTLSGDFYLCGPNAFLSDMIAGLELFGVESDHIHFETFGPVGVSG